MSFAGTSAALALPDSCGSGQVVPCDGHPPEQAGSKSVRGTKAARAGSPASRSGAQFDPVSRKDVATEPVVFANHKSSLVSSEVDSMEISWSR